MRKDSNLTDFTALTADMGNLAEDKVLAAVRALIRDEPEHAQQALDALSAGMDLVGEKFDSFEYFVGDLIFAGEIFMESLELIKPIFEPSGPQRAKVILATVEGDLHDIGKSMVRVTLEAKRFQIIDLGVNVSPATIVRRAIEEDAHLIALSAVLTSALSAMERTVEAFRDAGLREQVTIVVGGACVSPAVAKKIGADFYGKTPEDTAAIFLAAEANRSAPAQTADAVQPG